jgi:hypothetical protein
MLMNNPWKKYRMAITETTNGIFILHGLFYFACKDKVIIFDCSTACRTSIEISFVEHVEFRIILYPEPPFRA